MQRFQRISNLKETELHMNNHFILKTSCASVTFNEIAFNPEMFLRSSSPFSCLDIDLIMPLMNNVRPEEMTIGLDLNWDIHIQDVKWMANLTIHTFHTIYTKECKKASVTLTGLKGEPSQVQYCGKLENILTGLMSGADHLLVTLSGSFSSSDRIAMFYTYRSKLDKYSFTYGKHVNG